MKVRPLSSTLDVSRFVSHRRLSFSAASVAGTLSAFLLLALLIACGGSNNTPTPPPPPPSNPLTAVPSSLTFTSTTAQSFVVSGGSGTVTASNNCSNIAALTGPQSGAIGSWSVTPDLTTASCTATFTDTSNAAVTVNIGVQLGLAASPNTLNFTTTTAQTFSVTGGNGTITPTDTCAGIATLTPPASGIDGTWTVTPSANGNCGITFTDTSKTTAQVTISVSLSSTSALSVNPGTLTFNSASAQNFSVVGGNAPITELDDCSGVATLTGPPSGADGNWIVTPTNSSGFCTANFIDSTNAQASVTITDSITNPTSTLTWQMQLDSGCSTAVYLKFFDETANLQWPAQNFFYVLNQPGQVQSFALACTTGDNVCYGASLYQNSDQLYWGVGVLNDQSCANCCISCTTTTVSPIDLTGSGCASDRSNKLAPQPKKRVDWEKRMNR